jgi:hypothetical protein
MLERVETTVCAVGLSRIVFFCRNNRLRLSQLNSLINTNNLTS